MPALRPRAEVASPDSPVLRSLRSGGSKVRLSPRLAPRPSRWTQPFQRQIQCLGVPSMAPAGTWLDASNPTRETEDPPSPLPSLTRALLSRRPFRAALLRRRLAPGVPQIPASVADASPLVSVQTCITLSRLAGTAAKTEARVIC